jgi:hypothetical protein
MIQLLTACIPDGGDVSNIYMDWSKGKKIAIKSFIHHLGSSI